MAKNDSSDTRGLILILEDHASRIGGVEKSLKEILPQIGETSQGIKHMSSQLIKIDSTLEKFADYIASKIVKIDEDFSDVNDRFTCIEAKITSLEDSRARGRAVKKGLIKWASGVIGGVLIAVLVYFLQIR
jgi:chromosome segregation ATPase